MMRLRNTALLSQFACLVACSDDASETPNSSQLGFRLELVVGQTVKSSRTRRWTTAMAIASRSRHSLQ